MNPTNEKSDPTKHKSEEIWSEQITKIFRQKKPKVMIIEGKNEEINSLKIGENEKKAEEKEWQKMGTNTKVWLDNFCSSN